MPVRTPFYAFLLATAVLVSGCASTAVQPFQTERARPGTPSEKRDDLLRLPPPQNQVVAAVYRFRDQTGQYRRKEQGSTFSRAVTQGATSILVDALERSDWFVPIERRGLSNLLNERDIIRSTRQQYQGENAQRLPPLLFAGVTLEGGIIGYNTNVVTGGGGLRLFGIGGSGEYRQDEVTVYLRAVSTQNGRVLASVNTTKTIISQRLDADVFQFVASDLILETEAGITYNEPTFVAVKEAIDEALKNLIIEGFDTQAWSPADTVDVNLSEVVQEYRAAKARAARTDYFDRLLRPDNRSGFGIGVAAGGLKYQGDVEAPRTRGLASVTLRKPLSTAWEAGLSATYSEVAAEQSFDTPAIGADLQLRYYLLPYGAWTPFVQVSGGVQSQDPHTFAYGDTFFPVGGGDVGIQVMANARLAIDASFGIDYALDDGLDGEDVGRYTDSLWSGRLGLTVYNPF